MTDPNAFLMASGVKSFKFDATGATVKGTIVSLDMQQQQDIKTKAPLTWPDGNPKMQLRIILDTGVVEDTDDDGHRAIFVRGNMQQAVRDAIKKAEADRIEVGGTLAVKYERDGAKTNPAFDPPKEYRAAYEPPKTSPQAIDADDLL
ncbi:MAG: hypothetical protein ACRDYV_02145 [Acidimicrobiia bacterium]